MLFSTLVVETGLKDHSPRVNCLITVNLIVIFNLCLAKTMLWLIALLGVLVNNIFEEYMPISLKAFADAQQYKSQSDAFTFPTNSSINIKSVPITKTDFSI